MDFLQKIDKKIFHLIGSVADETGIECYLIGGFVRDLILQRE
jgi:tRNA nucleotidyltransferase/poly(A) polymerase